ncbi:MAG: Fic family protein [Methanomassiliicoccales archaeon]|nr:MAG: Fic family protein [Methanomassiliicoccales archaeon]
MERIDRKKRILDSKRPLPKDAVNRLQEDMRLLHTYHSNAIEGNTLTLQETKLVVEEGITIGGKSLKEHLEATGNAMAFERIVELAKARKKVDLVVVLELHEIVSRGLLKDAGRYRTQNIRIVGAKARPPDFSKVPALMDELLKEVSRMKSHPLVKAVHLHHKLVAIHPFSDGNGRVARLVSNLILMRSGYPPVVLKKEERKKYYNSLRKADSKNLGPFGNFVARALDESLTIYISIFGGEDELLPLSELAKDTSYSQEYLSLRARQGVLSAVKMGRTWHSTKRSLKEYIERYGR